MCLKLASSLNMSEFMTDGRRGKLFGMIGGMIVNIFSIIINSILIHIGWIKYIDKHLLREVTLQSWDLKSQPRKTPHSLGVSLLPCYTKRNDSYTYVKGMIEVYVW